MGDIRIGDRVRATHSKGDVAEFTVNFVYSNGSLSSEFGLICSITDGWTFEKITPPLPTEPGLYQPKDDGRGVAESVTYRLSNGRWSDMYNNEIATLKVKEAHESRGLYRLVREEIDG